jgi:antitoxin (DNA-binding transcriptional repressor) of toxin-antitoxin stability system
MLKINVTKLRNHLPKYLAVAHSGEEIWVTSYGKVIAKIVAAVGTKQEAISKLKKFRQHCKVGDVISPIKEK